MCGLDMFVILTIALSSEIASYRHGLMSSYYNTANSINKSLMLSCSSNVIYGYHLTGKRAGAPSGGMDYGMDNGMYSWWHHSVLNPFVPSFQISKNRH